MLDRVMALATAVTVAATLTGCGGSTEPRVAAEAAPSVEQLDIVDLASMRSSLWSLAAAGGDSVGVVVEGAGAGDPLRPALSVVEPDGTVAQRVALPVDNPLYGLDVAFDAEVAVVTGLLCARWTSLGDPPDLAATDEGTPEAACGSSSWVAGVWERSTGRWSELAVPAGSQVEALRYGRAVMSSVEPGSDGRWPERHLALVDTRSPGNEPAALDQFPVDPGGDVDAEVVLCLADSQVVSLVRWVEGEGPDGLPADATVLHSAGAQRWAAFVHEDKGWIAAEVDGTAPGPEAVGICTDGGIAAIAGDGAGAVLEAEGDRLRWKTVAGAPGGADDIAITGTEGGGAAYRAAPSPESTGGSPDAPRHNEITALVEGQWVSRGSVNIGSGSRVFFIGDVPFARQPHHEGTASWASIQMGEAGASG